MSRILISHAIDPQTVDELKLREVKYPLNKELAGIDKAVFYATNSSEECLYIPDISAKQKPEEESDPSLELLRQALMAFKPNVLIVGNNAVPGKAIRSWRSAVGSQQKLLAIRRGVDKRTPQKKSF